MKTALILLGLVSVALACDIIVHLKSDTDKKFEGQITASNGKKSEKFKFGKKLDRLTFQQKADECGLHPWHIVTYDAAGKEVANVEVTLDGTGRVGYIVGDDLRAKPKDRQGAICKGECAPLA